MIKILSTCLLMWIGLSSVVAVSEFDILGQNIALSLRSGEFVQVKELRDWYSLGSPRFIEQITQVQKSELFEDQDCEDTERIAQAFAGAVDVFIPTDKARVLFHRTFAQLDPLEQEQMIPVILNYLVAVSQ